MSAAFQPGVASAKAAGVPIEARPYPAGVGGIRMSVEEVAKKIRLGASDPGIKQHAYQAFADAGIDGRDRPSIEAQAQAILSYVQEHTLYAPDLGGGEAIQAAHVTLCVRDMCIPMGDCDDLTVAAGAMMLSVALPVFAVKVRYSARGGEEPQQHVLLGVVNERGAKLYADPSTRNRLERSTGAAEEVWINPLDQVNSVGTAGAEMITLGHPSTPARDVRWHDGRWWEYSGGAWYVHDRGQWWMRHENGSLIGMGRPTAGLGLESPFCTADTIVNKARAVNERIENLNTDLKSCPALDDATTEDFQRFRGRWFQWYSTLDANSFTGSCTRLREAEAFEKEAYDWQNKVAPVCVLRSPIEPPTKAKADFNVPIPNPADEINRTLATAAKVLAVGGLVFGGVYALWLVTPAIRRSLEDQKRK